MTQAWAIKGPDNEPFAIGLSETEAWAVAMWLYMASSKEALAKIGYTCVPVTITESSAEPVAWRCDWPSGWRQYHDEKTPLPKAWLDKPTITELFTAPPADESRALLERCYSVFAQKEGKIGDLIELADDIKDHLARSGK